MLSLKDFEKGCFAGIGGSNDGPILLAVLVGVYCEVEVGE